MFQKKHTEFHAEMEAHIQLEIDRLCEQGLSESEARAAALRTFGNRTSTEERFYESHPSLWLDRLWQNVRFGARMLLRNPASTVVAVLTLALAIGANTAIFSLTNAVILRNLPIPNPNQVVLFGQCHWSGSVDDIPNTSWQLFSYHFFQQFRLRNAVFADVAAVDSLLMKTHARIGGGHLEKISADLVSGSFFNTLGVQPSRGRLLGPQDDVTPGAHPVAVASYQYWRERFGGDPSAVGSALTIDSTTYTLVGVAPPGFFGVRVGEAPNLFIPLAMEKQVSPGWNGLQRDLFQSLYLFGRLKPGVSMQAASANTNVLFRRIMASFAEGRADAKEIAGLQRATIELVPGANGISQIRSRFSPVLWLLMAIVGVLLLIACANLANLLLARAAARQREMAIRISIGAGRTRLIRQLLIESALLGLAGAVLGIAFASIASRLLLRMVSSGPQVIPLDLTVDGRVLAFTLAVTVATVLLFGIFPALRATRLNLVAVLKEGRTSTSAPARGRLARALVVAQIALSLMLVAGAGLFLRSLTNLLNMPRGFDAANVLEFGVDPNSAGYRVDARLENLIDSAETRVKSLPGVEAASFVFSVFDGGGWTGPVSVPGGPSDPPEIFHNVVGSGYLDTVRIPLLFGRDFTDHDDASSRKVALINQTMARDYFPGVSPIGRTFTVADEPEWRNIEIVGVVRDGKYMRLQEKPTPAAFYPHAQHPRFLYRFLVRYHGGPRGVAAQVRQVFAKLDANLPVGDALPLATIVNNSLTGQKAVAEICGFFAIAAIVLACLGIYGVMSYGVARRTNELGIRMALGAERGQVLRMVLREVLALTIVGVAVGLALAAAESKLIANLLFGVGPFDPLSLGIAAAAMVAVALLAGYGPARRATRIDPLAALRYE